MVSKSVKCIFVTLWLARVWPTLKSLYVRKVLKDESLKVKFQKNDIINLSLLLSYWHVLCSTWEDKCIHSVLFLMEWKNSTIKSPLKPHDVTGTQKEFLSLICLYEPVKYSKTYCMWYVRLCTLCRTKIHWPEMFYVPNRKWSAVQLP